MIKNLFALLGLSCTTLSFASAPTPQLTTLPTTGDFDLILMLRSFIGMCIIIGIAWLFSSNRKAISWKLVLSGLAIQIILALCLLYIPFVQYCFELVGKLFVKTLSFSQSGTEFLFKSFSVGKIESPLLNFAFTILPTIIFFSALTSVLFYLGVIQFIVKWMAKALTGILKIGGAESLSVTGNIFLGQTESPLLIKGYLDKITKSEMLLVMAGGMATLAGGVLAVYIKVLGNGDPIQEVLYAKHLLAASIMAAPGVIVISKILIPQTETIEEENNISTDKIGKNILEAISNGTGDGIRLAVNVAAMLLVFIAFIAMANYFMLKIGQWTNLNATIESITNSTYHELSIQFILGYAFAPLMWLLGVSGADMDLVGRVLGEKIIMTEFIGYISLSDLKTAGAFVSPRSIIMATYMLCGFANFASIGIQIGGIGALAPGKKLMLTQLGIKALIAGTLASLLSATIIGMFWH